MEGFSVEEYNELLQEHQNQEKLIEIVTRIAINEKTKSNSLLAMVIECDPNFHCVSSKVADLIEQDKSTLVECLDVDNGLADCLFSKQVLTSEQYEKLSNKTRWDSYQEQNRELLSNMLPVRLKSEHLRKVFLAALVETDQRHIFNFICSKVQVNEDDDCRILTADELNKIDRNLFHLINLINPSPTLLDSLLRKGCITQRHKDRIDAQQTPSNKKKELLTIIRRKSYEDFKRFKSVMQETQENGMIVELLEQENGHVIRAHCEINIEPDAMMSSEHLTQLESKISNHLSDPTILSQSLTQEVTSKLNGLHEVGIDMIGATPTGSVMAYFSCQTFQSIVTFKQMVVNGELASILEELFNRILGLSALFRVRLIVSLLETEYRSCIEEARRTVYSKTKSNNHQLESECYIRHLPRELLELILLKSIVGIMSVEWSINVADIESGSDHLFETLSNKTWMSANISLKSVTYQWMPLRNLNREVAMKQFILQRLHEHYKIFAEQLNCRYMLVDCLEKDGVITDEERRNILEAGDDVPTRTYENIPESFWAQIRDSEQMLMSNKQLLKCLFDKNCFQISKFLKILNAFRLTHILNHFINSEGSQSFGDVWPLSYTTRNSIIEFGTAMLTNMNILLLSGERETMKTEREIRKKSLRYPLIFEKKIEFCFEGKNPEKILSKSSYEKILVYSRIDEFNRHPEVNPVRQNLIDLLYNEGCISLLHKQHIEQQISKQLRNLVMLQLIKNGSIKTFKVALEYFRSTNQSEVYNMLNRKCTREEIQSSEWIEGITLDSWIAVGWLENRIYVTSQKSNIVQVFQEGLKIKQIKLKGMKDPQDIIASQLSRSVFISDSENRCIWMIQMPGKRLTRWEIDGVPRNMSISSSDVLIVCFARGKRSYLNLYRSSEINSPESILLPRGIQYLIHAVQLLNGHFIISFVTYVNKYKLDSCRISELSSDGRIIIRSFDSRSFKLNSNYHWMPYYISVDEDENIFIADCENDRIVLLNSSWTDVQILLNNYQHEIESPWNLCYVREKQQLIVAQVRPNRSTHGVRIFDLRPHTPQPIDRRRVEHELEIIQSGLFEATHMNTEMREGWKPVQNKPELQLMKLFKVAGESSVVGVTWLGNKIYVVCKKSNKVHVFTDHELEEEGIEIEGMADPWDISASKVNPAIFISDKDNRCLWKVHTSDGAISRWEMDGRPETLSITPSKELLVVADREDHYDLIIFRCLDVNRLQLIPLPFDVKKIAHAVQSTNGNMFMSYSTKDFPDVFLISELSSDGRNLIRTFDPQSVKKMNVKNWRPGYLSFGEGGNLFVADFRRQKVYLLNYELTDIQNLLKMHHPNSLIQMRLCYVREKHMLIIGQEGVVSSLSRTT